MKKLIIAIDFDGVMHDKAHPITGRRMGAPIEGARDSVMRLKQRGHELYCYTVMAKLLSGKNAVEAWLLYYNFPEMEVTDRKPTCDIYLDDKAIRFENWNQSMEAINEIYKLKN